VPRTHQEVVADQSVKLGVWISNQRAQRAALAVERVAALTELGMRWS
jgi:hypothetical protein